VEELTKGQFLQGTAVSFGEEKVNKDDFEGQEATVRDKIAPADVGQADGVDEGSEEVGKATKELEPGNTTGPRGEGP